MWACRRKVSFCVRYVDYTAENSYELALGCIEDSPAVQPSTVFYVSKYNFQYRSHYCSFSSTLCVIKKKKKITYPISEILRHKDSKESSPGPSTKLGCSRRGQGWRLQVLHALISQEWLPLNTCGPIFHLLVEAWLNKKYMSVG